MADDTLTHLLTRTIFVLGYESRILSGETERGFGCFMLKYFGPVTIDSYESFSRKIGGTLADSITSLALAAVDRIRSNSPYSLHEGQLFSFRLGLFPDAYCADKKMWTFTELDAGQQTDFLEAYLAAYSRPREAGQ